MNSRLAPKSKAAVDDSMSMKIPLLLCLMGAFFLRAAAAENWPQWRGPHFNGSARTGPLPGQFSRADACWVTPLPAPAGSTPVVWGDRIFLTSPDDGKNLNLLCLEAMSGKILWTRTVAVGDKDKGRNNMAAPSPVTDGKRVIALFGTGDAAAFDFEGNELWKRPLYRDYGRFAIMWIYGASPLLQDDQLIIPVLQRDEMPADYPLFDGKPERESFLLSLDPATGKTLWKVARTTDSRMESHESYATPVPYRGAHGLEILIVGGDHVSGHDPKNGTELWRARLYQKRDDWYRIVTSAVAADGLIYASGPKGQPVVAFRDGGKGDVTSSHRVWEFSDAPTDWATPLLYDGKLFVLDGGRRILSRLDPRTGKVVWTGKLEVADPIWSSPTGADGKIYMVSEKGSVVVLSAGDEFKVLSRLDLDDGPARSTVVPTSKGILVRTAHNLYCFCAK